MYNFRNSISAKTMLVIKKSFSKILIKIYGIRNLSIIKQSNKSLICEDQNYAKEDVQVNCREFDRIEFYIVFQLSTIIIDWN